MFGRAIWDKIPKYVFENFEIVRVKRGIVLKLISFNSGQLQNITVNRAMSISINHVLISKMIVAVQYKS